MKPTDLLSSPPARIAWWVAGFLILLVAVWKTTYGLESVMDIRFYDESYYLTQGLFHPVRSFIADYSALYCLYYKALSQFSLSDGIALYYANYRLWSFIMSVVVFGVLRLSGCHLGFALIWAVSATCAQINLPLWPKAGHLAMLGVSVALAGFVSLKDKPLNASFWIAGMFLMISWCRPEFLAGSLAALSLFLFYLIRNRFRIEGNVSFWIFVPWIAATALFFLWGFPMGQSGRGMVAFGQHVVHNWRNISGQNSGDLMEDWVNWREIFGRIFGKADGIVSAFVHNPGAMFQHLWFNLRYVLYNSFTYFFESLFPARWLGIPVSLCIGSLWLAGEYFHGFNGLASFWNRAVVWFKRYGMLFGLLAIPSVLAGLLFQPRPHYILPLFPLFLFGIGKLAATYRFNQFAEHWKFGFGAGVLVAQLFFLPDASAFYALRAKGEQSSTNPDRKEPFGIITSENLHQKDLIRKLRQMDWPAGTRMFDASTGATEYLGTAVTQCGKTGFEMNYDALSNFQGFLQKEKVNRIFLRSTIYYDHFFNRNAAWQQLRSRPESMGWEKVAITEWGDSLFVKR